MKTNKLKTFWYKLILKLKFLNVLLLIKRFEKTNKKLNKKLNQQEKLSVLIEIKIQQNLKWYSQKIKKIVSENEADLLLAELQKSLIKKQERIKPS